MTHKLRMVMDHDPCFRTEVQTNKCFLEGQIINMHQCQGKEHTNSLFKVSICFLLFLLNEAQQVQLKI